MCSGEISMGQVGQVHVLLEYFGDKTGSFINTNSIVNIGDTLGRSRRKIATCCRYTVNLCLVTIKYKNPSWTKKTVPQKYVFDFKE